MNLYCLISKYALIPRAFTNTIKKDVAGLKIAIYSDIYFDGRKGTYLY